MYILHSTIYTFPALPTEEFVYDSRALSASDHTLYSRDFYQFYSLVKTLCWLLLSVEGLNVGFRCDWQDFQGSRRCE